MLVKAPLPNGTKFLSNDKNTKGDVESKSYQNYAAASPDATLRLQSFITSSGDIYEGETSTKNRHMPHGTGRLTRFVPPPPSSSAFTRSRLRTRASVACVYVGSWVEGRQDGRGRFLGSDGFHYDGEWKDGAAQGFGRAAYPHGAWYEGEWRANARDGWGVLVAAPPAKEGRAPSEDEEWTVFEGQWHSDKIQGQGRFTWSDGSYFEGSFENGIRKVGTWMSAKRSLKEGETTREMYYIGNFNASGLYSGAGEFVIPNVLQYNGQWLYGTPHGYGTCHCTSSLPLLSTTLPRILKALDGVGEGDDVSISNNLNDTMDLSARQKWILDLGIGGKIQNILNPSSEKACIASTATPIALFSGGILGHVSYCTADAQEDELEASEKFIQRYAGEWQKGYWHGRGRWEFVSLRSGKVVKSYDGEWKQGVRHGFGTAMTCDRKGRARVSYKGRWCDDLAHGQGEWWVEGHGEQGEGKGEGNSKANMQGLERDQEKEEEQKEENEDESLVRYSGGFHNGLRHGQGSAVFSDGGCYEGSWENDVRHGHGRMVFRDGSSFSGDWENGIWIQGPAYPGRTRIIGSEIAHAMAGERSGFRIQAMDEKGNQRLNGGDVFQIQIQMHCQSLDSMREGRRREGGGRREWGRRGKEKRERREKRGSKEKEKGVKKSEIKRDTLERGVEEELNQSNLSNETLFLPFVEKTKLDVTLNALSPNGGTSESKDDRNMDEGNAYSGNSEKDDVCIDAILSNIITTTSAIARSDKGDEKTTSSDIGDDDDDTSSVIDDEYNDDPSTKESESILCESIPCKVLDNDDGTYDVTYCTTIAGLYEVYIALVVEQDSSRDVDPESVNVEGQENYSDSTDTYQPIADSPYLLRVAPCAPCLRRFSIIDNPNPSFSNDDSIQGKSESILSLCMPSRRPALLSHRFAVADQRNEIWIQARDTYGNHCDAAQLTRFLDIPDDSKTDETRHQSNHNRVQSSKDDGWSHDLQNLDNEDNGKRKDAWIKPILAEVPSISPPVSMLLDLSQYDVFQVSSSAGSSSVEAPLMGTHQPGGPEKYEAEAKEEEARGQTKEEALIKREKKQSSIIQMTISQGSKVFISSDPKRPSGHNPGSISGRIGIQDEVLPGGVIHLSFDAPCTPGLYVLELYGTVDTLDPISSDSARRIQIQESPFSLRVAKSMEDFIIDEEKELGKAKGKNAWERQTKKTCCNDQTLMIKSKENDSVMVYEKSDTSGDSENEEEQEGDEEEDEDEDEDEEMTKRQDEAEKGHLKVANELNEGEQETANKQSLNRSVTNKAVDYRRKRRKSRKELEKLIAAAADELGLSYQEREYIKLNPRVPVVSNMEDVWKIHEVNQLLKRCEM